MSTDLDDLPRPACPWSFPGAPLDCATLDAPTTYRVTYEHRPAGIDSYSRICIDELGGEYPGKVHSIPMCSDHDATVATALDQLGIAPPPGAAFVSWVPDTGAVTGSPAGGAAPYFVAWSGGASSGGAFSRMVSPGSSGSGQLKQGEADSGPFEPGGVTTGEPYTSDPLPVPLPPSALSLAVALILLAGWAAARLRPVQAA